MQVVKLKDICIGKGEYGIAASAEDYSEDKYRYLRITDISDYGALLDNDRKSVSCTGCEKYLLSEDEIVFARTGNSTGRAFFYESKYGPLVFAGFLIKFHLDKTKVNPKFMKYFTISKTYKNWIANGPTGSTRGNMSEGDFADMPVFLPERKEQDALVKIMEPIDSKIIGNDTICADLEAMAKLLYDYWFVQFDFPDENGKPYKSSGGKMVWNEDLKREIPEGWEVHRLGDLITYNRGVSYTGKDLDDVGTPIISLASIDRSGRYIPDGIKYYNQSYPSSKVIKPFDLVMANTDMTQERAVMGRIIFVPDIFDGDILSTHHITQIHVKDELKSYLMMTTQTDWFHNYIKGFSSGTNVLGMDMIGFEDYLLACPKTHVLQHFNSIIYQLYKKIFNGYKENSELVSLRDFLLPMLMNGQVKVGGKDDLPPVDYSTEEVPEQLIAAEPNTSFI